MKQILLLLSLPFLFLFSLMAQITQQEADQIIIERLCNETGDFTIYAKEDVQTNFEIATATGETLELGYLCWVYYVNYKDATTGKYLIVKESNGNLLEVNTKNDGIPDDLENWRIIDNEYPIEIPFTEYSLAGTSCQWVNLNYDEEVIVINSDEELENYIDCTEGDFPQIDFSINTLLLASGRTNKAIFNITKNIKQLSCSEYELNIEVLLYEPEPVEEWVLALKVVKWDSEARIGINVTYSEVQDVPFEEYSLSETLCLWTNVSIYLDGGNKLIIINSEEELEQYISCAEGVFTEIDFSQYTLLLTKGRTNMSSIININKNLLKLSSNEYLLKIELLCSNPDWTDECWIVALLIEKIGDGCNVVLNTTTAYFDCPYENLIYPANSGNLLLINSAEQLEFYLSCYEESYLAVDFSNHSVILLSGISYSKPVEVVVKDFQLLSSNQYKLDIEVYRAGFYVVEKWIYAIILKKINAGSNIGLNVVYTEI